MKYVLKRYSSVAPENFKVTQKLMSCVVFVCHGYDLNPLDIKLKTEFERFF